MPKKQTSLFNPKKYPDKEQAKKHQQWLASLTPSDKAYLKLKQNKLASQHNIYSGEQLKKRLEFYLTNGNLFGDREEKFHQWLDKINPKRYYHCIPDNVNPFKSQLYEYNGMLMDMILKSFTK